MSTNDVPGANPANNDVLAMGCWAEHQDGSLLFVESSEGNRIVYSLFDLSKTPTIEYRDAMPETAFKKNFSWDPKGKRDLSNEKWTWHDKTPFNWDKVIKAGAADGTRVASAHQLLSAAQRVAESLRLHGQEFQDNGTMTSQSVQRAGGIFGKIKRAVAELRS